LIILLICLSEYPVIFIFVDIVFLVVLKAGIEELVLSTRSNKMIDMTKYVHVMFIILVSNKTVTRHQPDLFTLSVLSIRFYIKR
jgi:hypothetical protein